MVLQQSGNLMDHSKTSIKTGLHVWNLWIQRLEWRLVWGGTEGTSYCWICVMQWWVECSHGCFIWCFGICRETIRFDPCCVFLLPRRRCLKSAWKPSEDESRHDIHDITKPEYLLLTQLQPQKLTASLHLKIDGWKTILSLYNPAHFQRLTVGFREGNGDITSNRDQHPVKAYHEAVD